MNNTSIPPISSSKPTSTVGARAEAQRLLKQFRSNGPESTPAAERFRRLRSFADLPVEELLASRGRVRLKHALAVVAMEHGHSSWVEWKRSLEGLGNEIYTPSLGFFLNRWFTKYVDARESLDREGGYLFPHGDQYFIAEAEAVRELGLDPLAPEWNRIEFDWARPADLEAHRRLEQLRLQALRGRATNR
jgi:hypothetical protein